MNGQFFERPAKPSIPTTVKVGPYDWTIVPDHEMAQVDEVWGTTLIPSHQIRLDPQAPPARLRATLLHEVLHVVMNVSGLSFRFNDKEDRVNEESVVREVSTLLYQVIRDNPDLVEYLLEEV